MVLVTLTACVLVAFTLREQLVPETLQAFFRSIGDWSAPMFVAGFALATVCFLPGSLFGLAGGAIFGPLWGAVWNLLGGTAGATLAFLFARHIGADWLSKKSGPQIRRITDGVEAEGWRFVALTRLIPIVPFNVLNYALGLTRVRLSHYVMATAICMLPGTAAYAWLGHAGRAAVDGDGTAINYGLLGLGVLAAILLLPRLIARFRREPDRWISVGEFKERLSRQEGLQVVDVRGPDEFAGPLGHIPRSINVPLDQIETRLSEINAVAGRQVVLVCKTDKRSAKAAEILRAHGVDQVRVLRGGMESWHQHVQVSPVD
jgi:uncharacterized membrane protein YdjX (TVP38/TMEM64 family)/rhodanese-related sulfurtransferase